MALSDNCMLLSSLEEFGKRCDWSVCLEHAQFEIGGALPAKMVSGEVAELGEFWT